MKVTLTYDLSTDTPETWDAIRAIIRYLDIQPVTPEHGQVIAALSLLPLHREGEINATVQACLQCIAYSVSPERFTAYLPTAVEHAQALLDSTTPTMQACFMAALACVMALSPSKGRELLVAFDRLYSQTQTVYPRQVYGELSAVAHLSPRFTEIKSVLDEVQRQRGQLQLPRPSPWISPTMGGKELSWTKMRFCGMFGRMPSWTSVY